MTKGLGNILKQAQEIHAKISQLQEEMAGKTVEASSGGGMVNIVMNGKQEVLPIRIDPEVVNREDVEMLQDLIAAAVNEAIRKSQEMMTEEMKKITGGLVFPVSFEDVQMQEIHFLKPRTMSNTFVQIRIDSKLTFEIWILNLPHLTFTFRNVDWKKCLPHAKPIDHLIEALTRLPGIGKKTASRLAFHILRSSSSEAQELARAILDVKEKIHLCSVCFNLTDEDPCRICQDERRNQRDPLCRGRTE